MAHRRLATGLRKTILRSLRLSIAVTVAMRLRSKLAKRESGFFSSQENRFGSPIFWYGCNLACVFIAIFASFRWDLHQERLSHHCDVAIASYRGASVRQRPVEEPTSLRESVNSIRGTFAHEMLNIRYAIRDLDQENRRTGQASPGEA